MGDLRVYLNIPKSGLRLLFPWQLNVSQVHCVSRHSDFHISLICPWPVIPALLALSLPPYLCHGWAACHCSRGQGHICLCFCHWLTDKHRWFCSFSLDGSSGAKEICRAGGSWFAPQGDMEGRDCHLNVLRNAEVPKGVWGIIIFPVSLWVIAHPLVISSSKQPLLHPALHLAWKRGTESPQLTSWMESGFIYFKVKKAFFQEALL